MLFTDRGCRTYAVGLRGIASVAAGTDHSVALHRNGHDVYTWVRMRVVCPIAILGQPDPAAVDITTRAQSHLVVVHWVLNNCAWCLMLVRAAGARRARAARLRHPLLRQRAAPRHAAERAGKHSCGYVGKLIERPTYCCHSCARGLQVSAPLAAHRNARTSTSDWSRADAERSLVTCSATVDSDGQLLKTAGRCSKSLLAQMLREYHQLPDRDSMVG
eukprot:SAG11_NODE_5059_length_1677_cov_1.162864_3_plen_217_part_00